MYDYVCRQSECARLHSKVIRARRHQNVLCTHLKLDQVHPPVRTDIYLESVQMDSRLQVDILSIFQRKEREDKKTMFLN